MISTFEADTIEWSQFLISNFFTNKVYFIDVVIFVLFCLFVFYPSFSCCSCPFFVSLSLMPCHFSWTACPGCFFYIFFISAYFSFYSLFILDEERVLLNGWDCSFSTNRDILPVLPVTNTNLRFHKAGEAPLFTSLIFTHTPNKSGCNTLFSYVSSKYRTLHRNGL